MTSSYTFRKRTRFRGKRITYALHVVMFGEMLCLRDLSKPFILDRKTLITYTTNYNVKTWKTNIFAVVYTIMCTYKI